MEDWAGGDGESRPWDYTIIPVKNPFSCGLGSRRDTSPKTLVACPRKLRKFTSARAAASRQNAEKTKGRARSSPLLLLPSEKSRDFRDAPLSAPVSLRDGQTGCYLRAVTPPQSRRAFQG